LPIGNHIVTFVIIDIGFFLCVVLETKETHPPPSGTQRQRLQSVSIQEGSGKLGCILSLGSLSPIVLVLFDDDAVVVSLYQVVASLGIADVIMKSWTLSIVSAAKFRMPNDTISSFAREKLQATAAVDACHIGRTGLGAGNPRIA
jgi:hypothetical protein